MSSEQILSVVASGAIGTVIALVIQIIWQERSATKRIKVDCLRRVVAYRSGPASREFAVALNEVFVTFNRSNDVIAQMVTFQRDINSRGGHSNDILLDLIKAMMRDVGMKHDHIDDSLLLSPIRGNATTNSGA